MMPKRNSRHGAFIEQIVAAINDGAKAKDLFRSSAYRNSEIPRRRHTETMITSWRQNTKECRRPNVSRITPSPFSQLGSEISSTTTVKSLLDAQERKEDQQDNKQVAKEEEKEKDLKDTTKDRGEAVNEITTPAADIGSTTTPKPEKHIHPCKCDLTSEQLRRIREYEEMRQRSREILEQRIRALQDYFDSKRITPRRSVDDVGGPTKAIREEEDDDEDKYLRERIDRVKIIKRKPKKKPTDRRQPKKKVQRKKYGKPFKVKVKKLKINYKKPPLIPVKPTRTSILRFTEHAYCPNTCYVPPIQPRSMGDGTFEVHFKASTEVPIKKTKTSNLRLEKAKNWKPPPPEVFKYNRPPFEANTRIYKELKPVKANIA